MNTFILMPPTPLMPLKKSLKSTLFTQRSPTLKSGNRSFILSPSHFQKVIWRTGFEMKGDGPKDRFIKFSNDDISKSAPLFPLYTRYTLRLLNYCGINCTINILPEIRFGRNSMVGAIPWWAQFRGRNSVMGGITLGGIPWEQSRVGGIPMEPPPLFLKRVSSIVIKCTNQVFPNTLRSPKSYSPKSDTIVDFG